MHAVDFYKCLAETTRLKCLLLLTHSGELCVCELTAALNDSQPKVSRHLARLRECQLLVDERRGQWVYYKINPQLDKWMHESLERCLLANQHIIKDDLARLIDSNCNGD